MGSDLAHIFWRMEKSYIGSDLAHIFFVLGRFDASIL